MSRRQEEFQKPLNLDTLQRKRVEGAVELRKKRRAEHVFKKRAIEDQVGHADIDADLSSNQNAIFELNWVPESLADQFPLLVNAEVSGVERFHCLLEAILGSSDIPSLFELVKLLRMALSAEHVPPIDSIFAFGIDVKLLELLRTQPLEFKNQCIWCIINLTCGPQEYSQKLVDNGLVELLATLLDTEDPTLIEHSAWTIGNLSSDSTETRDRIIQSGAALKVLRALKNRQDFTEEQVSMCVWALSNLVKGKPAPPMDLVNELVQFVPTLIQSAFEETVYDCLWILSYVSDGDLAGIQLVISTELAPGLLEICTNPASKLVTPALRTVGNIVSGDDSHTQYLLNLGLLDKLNVLLTTEKRELKKEALWAFSNVFAGNAAHIDMGIQHSCFNHIGNIIHSGDPELKKEALWSLLNITSRPQFSLKLVDSAIFLDMCALLVDDEPGIVLMTLEAIENTLKASKEMDPTQQGPTEVAVKLSEWGILEQIEQLQAHRSKKVYESVVKIMQNYYEIDSVENTDEIQEPVPIYNLA